LTCAEYRNILTPLFRRQDAALTIIP
jgi:hypothetical protein